MSMPVRDRLARLPGLTAVALLASCAHAAAHHHAELETTPPSVLCKDATLSASAFCMPGERMEQLLRDTSLAVLDVKATSHGVTGAEVLLVQMPTEKLVVRVKWKAAPHGGSAVNNDPRKELAAYELQKLVLDPAEYVIPPTVGRCLPLDFYKTDVRGARPSFDGTKCVFGVLVYWLEHVIELPPLDKTRFAANERYRTAIANMNLVTYLISHRDTRASNFVLSRDADDPRAFSIDNGLAFSGIENPQTAFLGQWSRIMVPKLPHQKIERLRQLTRADLDKLAVVAQYTLHEEQLDPAPATAPLRADIGVRREGDVLQLGLTKAEIDGVETRIRSLLRDAESGKLEVY